MCVGLGSYLRSLYFIVHYVLGHIPVYVLVANDFFGACSYACLSVV
jgi:hypothetical protein